MLVLGAAPGLRKKTVKIAVLRVKGTMLERARFAGCDFRMVGSDSQFSIQHCANYVPCERRGSEKSTCLAIFWGLFIFSGAPVL